MSAQYMYMLKSVCEDTCPEDDYVAGQVVITGKVRGKIARLARCNVGAMSSLWGPR